MYGLIPTYGTSYLTPNGRKVVRHGGGWALLVDDSWKVIMHEPNGAATPVASMSREESATDLAERMNAQTKNPGYPEGYSFSVREPEGTTDEMKFWNHYLRVVAAKVKEMDW